MCDVLSAPSIHQASDVIEVRCLVLWGLPVILSDDPSTFYKACFVSNFDFSLPPLLLLPFLAPPIYYLPSSPSTSFPLSPPPLTSSPVLYLPCSPSTLSPLVPCSLPPLLPPYHTYYFKVCVC